MVAPYACAQFTLATMGATQDFTIGGESRTPVAALFQWSGATALSTNTNHAVASWGATDGTREWFGSLISENAVAALSDAYTLHNTDAVIVHLDGTGAIVGQLSFNSFIAGGVTLNIDTAPAAAWIGQIFFFYEGDFRVDTFTTGATAGVATSVTTTGVTPPTFLVVQEFGDQAFGATVQAHARVSLGFVADNGGDLQAGSLWMDADAVATTTAFAVTNNATASGFITAGTDATVSYVFTASGFDATPQLQNLAHNVGYLAGDIPDVLPWAGHLTFPTAAGTHDFTESGAPVSAGLVCQTALTSEVLATGGATEGWGSGMFDSTSGADFSLNIQTDDARNAVINNTLTRCFVADVLFHVHAPPTTTLLAAAFTGVSATGFTVNVTTNPAATRLMPALLFGPYPVYYAIEETLNLQEEIVFAARTAIAETLNLQEEIAFSALVAVEETLQLVEEVPFAARLTIEETLSLVEEVSPLGAIAIEEQLTILEEVEGFTLFTPSPASPSGEGSFTGVAEGEGGQAGVVIGG